MALPSSENLMLTGRHCFMSVAQSFSLVPSREAVTSHCLQMIDHIQVLFWHVTAAHANGDAPST